ncbi:MAG: hypothetical protein WCG29_05380 [Desulfomonile sp.]|jgi:hypothetical protein|nr:hypothetical protein [Deltaproteobacteria bacterium]
MRKTFPFVEKTCLQLRSMHVVKSALYHRSPFSTGCVKTYPTDSQKSFRLGNFETCPKASRQLEAVVMDRLLRFFQDHPNIPANVTGMEMTNKATARNPTIMTTGIMARSTHRVLILAAKDTHRVALSTCTPFPLTLRSRSLD